MALTSEEWIVLASMSFLGVVAMSYATIAPVDFWSGLGLWFTCVVFGHMCMTSDRQVAFPDMIALAACLEWVVAPWLAATYPPNFPMFRMTLGSDKYLGYAVPATIALWAGLHLAADRKLPRDWTAPAVSPLSKPVRRVLDVMIVIGLLVTTFGNIVPVAYGFLVYLLASFRFFGALSWMVTRTPGWWFRVAVVLLHLSATESTGGLFYIVIHWGGFFVLVYAFMSRWRWQLAVAVCVGILGLGVLQTVKPTFRQSLTAGEVSGPVESFTRLTDLMWERISGAEDATPFPEFGDFLVRFNQGWIISRVMVEVPDREPYANGGTLLDAAIFSIVPRPLFPSKRAGTSRALFKRYTGVGLSESTSMGLGIIGELYANFGKTGGILCTFAYGGLMGWLFAVFAVRAVRNPLWWAAASVVLLPGIEPGFNVEDIMNHVVKAGVLLIVLLKTIPALRMLLAVDPLQRSDSGQPAAPTLA